MLTESLRPTQHPYQTIGLLLPLGFMAGATLAGGYTVPAWFGWLSLMLGIGVVVLEAITKVRALVIRSALVWTMVALGILWTGWFAFKPGPRDVMWRGDLPKATVEGSVVGTGNSPEKWVVAVSQVNGEPVNGQILAQSQIPLSLGTQVRLVGKLYRPDGPHYPGAFDYPAYLQHQHITMRMWANEVSVMSHRPTTIMGYLLHWADTLRHRMTNAFNQGMPGAAGQILASMVLGEHAVGLAPEVKQAFQEAGLIHLLAASGMNVALVGGLFLGLGYMCRVPWRLKVGLAMAGVAFYMLLTGLPPSVLRAGTMLELALLLKLLGKNLEPLLLLCLAGGILTFWNPDVVMLTGFQLSFLSAFGLLAMMPYLQKRVGFYLTQWGAGILLAPLVAQLWVTPILWSQFGHVQLLALPANIVVLPVVALLTYLGFALGGVSVVFPTASQWLLPWLSPLVLWVNQVAVFFSSLPLSQLTLPKPSLPLTLWMLTGLATAAALAWQNKALSRQSLSMGLGVFALGIFLPLAVFKADLNQHTQLVRIQPNPSQMAWVILPQRQSPVVLVSHLSRPLLWDVSGYLKTLGIGQVDTLILTEAPKDQGLDLAAVAEVLPFRNLALSPHWRPETLATLAQQAQAGHHSLIPLASTQVTRLGQQTLTLYTLPQTPIQGVFTGRICQVLGSSKVMEPSIGPELQAVCQGPATHALESSFIRWLD